MIYLTTDQETSLPFFSHQGSSSFPEAAVSQMIAIRHTSISSIH